MQYNAIIYQQGESSLYEEGQGADESLAINNIPKLLVNCPGGGIVDGSILSIDDFSQSLEVSTGY